MKIRDYRAETDLEGLQACVVELQDFEREFDSRFPDGAGIVDEYIPDILKRCERYDGKILVADEADEVIGYAMVWTNVPSEDIEDGDFVCGYLADLAVLRAYRRRGVGQALIAAAEDHARAHGVRYFRIGVMAANKGAQEIYRAAGYKPFSVEFEKCL